MGTCETPNRSRDIVRAFASSRSSRNCGWCMDGTVAANAKSYKYFIVLYFWHALERENVDNENQYLMGSRMRAGAHCKHRSQNESRAIPSRSGCSRPAAQAP